MLHSIAVVIFAASLSGSYGEFRIPTKGFLWTLQITPDGIRDLGRKRD